MNTTKDRIYKSLAITSFFKMYEENERYFEEVDATLRSKDYFLLSIDNWPKHKKAFFKQRYYESPTMSKAEFIATELHYLNNIDTVNTPLSVNDKGLIRFLMLKEKYIKFLNEEAGQVETDLIFKAFTPSENLTSKTLNDLYKTLLEGGYITCFKDVFKKAFSGKSTAAPLKIEFKGSAILLYNFLKWLYDNKLIVNNDFSAVNENGGLFLYCRAGKYKAPVQLRGNARRPPPPQFAKLERLLKWLK